MRIGIQDIDGHNFPNFALMRIAAFHRLRGDSVEMAVPLFGEYDRVYQSKIFTFSPDNTTPWQCEVYEVIPKGSYHCSDCALNERCHANGRYAPACVAFGYDRNIFRYSRSLTDKLNKQ